MSVAEGKVCRAVIDRHDVMKTQTLEVVAELLRSSVTTDVHREINQRIEEIFRVHTDGLVGNISKQFSDR